MKNHSLPFLAFLALGPLLAPTGCSDDHPKVSAPDSVSASSTPAPAAAPAALVAPAAVSPTTDPFAEILMTLQNVTADQNTGLTAVQERMDRSITEQLAVWKADGRPVTGAADEKFTNARADFAEKLKILSFAGDDTWSTAKRNAMLSLQNLRAAYDELPAGPPKG